jgi:hypothetical protein
MTLLTMISLAMILPGLSGCAGSAPEIEGREKTLPVTGTVTLDGEPLADATVTFHGPLVGKAGKPGLSAVGTTDSDGKFRLTTYEANDGAAAETYQVSVTKVEAAETTGSTEGEYVPPEAKARPAAPRSLVPEKYTTPAQSGLTATVTDGKDNEFTFELTTP